MEFGQNYQKEKHAMNTQFILELKPSRFEKSLNNYCLANLIATIINLRLGDFVNPKRVSFLSILEIINDLDDSDLTIVDLVLLVFEDLKLDLEEETKNEIMNEIVEEIGFGNLAKYNY